VINQDFFRYFMSSPLWSPSHVSILQKGFWNQLAHVQRVMRLTQLELINRERRTIER
jgi:hypothetical protein